MRDRRGEARESQEEKKEEGGEVRKVKRVF
jgi:hypothetical protein